MRRTHNEGLSPSESNRKLTWLNVADRRRLATIRGLCLFVLPRKSDVNVMMPCAELRCSHISLAVIFSLSTFLCSLTFPFCNEHNYLSHQRHSAETTGQEEQVVEIFHVPRKRRKMNLFCTMSHVCVNIINSEADRRGRKEERRKGNILETRANSDL